MSYWALTVITNLMTVLPVVGVDVLCYSMDCISVVSDPSSGPMYVMSTGTRRLRATTVSAMDSVLLVALSLMVSPS